MLRFIDPTASHHRREFLRITGRWGLSAAGLGALGGGWPLGASETDSLESLATGKSVIFLFLHGGPSQIETFDPKMDAPAEIRSTTGQINTSLPGYRFGGTFPQLAQRADRLLVVRSFRTGDGTHDIKPIVGRNTGGANIGSLYTRVVGTSAPESGMPMNVALFPRAVDPTTQAENNSFGRFTDTGTLGAICSRLRRVLAAGYATAVAARSPGRPSPAAATA